MEEEHKYKLKGEFTRMFDHKHIHVPKIPDECRFLNPELVEMLKQSVNSLLELA